MLKQRIICALLVVCLACAAGLAGAEEETERSFIMAGFDATTYSDWLNNRFFMRMEERTGVHFVLRQSKTEADWAGVKASLKPGAEGMPDVLFKAALSTQECVDLRANGVLIDLKPYLEENCPNLMALIHENPEILELITLPDGSVAALPFITALPEQNYMYINQKWLNNLGLSMPTNTEELEAVLIAFRDRDPNRNGKNDETPLSFEGPFDLKFLAHGFGLIANDYQIFEEDGKVRFMPTEKNYRAFVEWCRRLYEENLLDKNGFSALVSMYYGTENNDASATVGMVMTYLVGSIYRASWSNEYVIMPPLVYEGRQVYREFAMPVTRGCFAITSACKDPALMLQWVDYLYSEEGATLALAGAENVEYVVDGDGTWRLTDSQQSEYERALSTVDGGARIPGIENIEFQSRYGASAELRQSLEGQTAFQQYVVRPFPAVYLTPEQQAEIAPLQAKIGEYTDVMFGRWVTGDEEISDASFIRFEETLNELGLQEFLDFWQRVLDQQKGGSM